MPIADRSRGLKVVIDTNVFVSGLNFSGRPREVLGLMRKGRIEVIVSSFILKELREVLRKDFGWGEERVRDTIRLIEIQTSKVDPKIGISIVKEKDSDNRILECAFEGKVQYIVSGDKRHILPLKKFQGIEILSPADFLEIL